MNFEDLPGPEKESSEVDPNQNKTETPVEDKEDALEPSQLQKALQKYWAVKPPSECVEECIKKSNLYYNYLSATGKMSMYRLAFEQYNRGFLTLASISRNGIEGELLNLPVNEFRNIMLHLLSLTTKEKVQFEPQGANSDYTTGAKVTFSRDLLNYYVQHRDVDELGIRATENDLIFGEGYVYQTWDQHLGDIGKVDITSQQVYKNGDIQHVVLNPTDVIRDVHIGNMKNNLWFIVRLFINKYELAAQYPDLADQIVERGINNDWDNSRLTNNKQSDSDLVPLFIFLHKATSALPFGREIHYLDSDVILEDGHLSSRDFPLKIMASSPTESINFAYTVAYDLLPLQQVLDILYSAVTTNNVNFAVSNVIIPENCNMSVQDIIGGMNLLKYNPTSGKPEVLNLVLTPKEVYDFIDRVTQRMNVLAGINDVVRGQPEASLKSGAALALMASQAIHFNSDLQRSYVKLMGEIGTGILHLLQDNASEPRLAQIGGESDKPYLKEFTSKDLEGVDRISVTVGSAFAQSDAGKLQMAQDLIASGLMKDPQEYLEVVETGSLKRLTEGQHNSLMLIKRENEMLAKGQTAIAAMTDDHVTHILEHQNVIANPELRLSQDPAVGQIVQNTMNHIQEHIQLLSTMPPILAAVLKQPVINQPPAPGGPQQPPTGNGAQGNNNGQPPAPKPAGPQPGVAPTPPPGA